MCWRLWLKARNKERKDMNKRQINSKKGFTIIEVVLVLAIAALIFLMVFIAVPALGRSQRDTQRRDDLSRATSALQTYQSNNSGSNPTGKGVVTVAKGSSDETNLPTNEYDSWKGFYVRYLLVKDGTSDKFEDPDGTRYGLNVVSCGDNLKNGDTCVKGQKTESWTEQTKNGHRINVVTNASCNGEKAVYSSGERKVAFLYKLEGGGVLCNQL